MTDRRLRAGLAGLVFVLLACVGCGSGSDGTANGPATPSAAPPPPAAPAMGACYVLTTKQAVAPTTTASAEPCKGSHTAETFVVGKLHQVVDGHLVSVASDHVAHQIASTCRSRLTRFLGGSEAATRLSMVRPVWFTPTATESDAGADWFRCDAVVVGTGGELATRSGSLAGVLKSKKKAAGLAMCGTAAPTAKTFQRVPCAAHHSWRAVSVVPLKSTGTYPGVKAARAAGKTKCEDAASAGAKNPLSFQWGYEWPTAADWARDQRYGICWAKQA